MNDRRIVDGMGEFFVMWGGATLVPCQDRVKLQSRPYAVVL